MASRIVLALIASVLALKETGCTRESPSTDSASGAAHDRGSAPMAALQLYPSPPLSPRHEPIHSRILSARGRGDFVEAAKAYEELLRELEREWGAGDARLAPHHYGLCLALKLAGSATRGLAEVARGLERWPLSLGHRLQDAVLRMELSTREGRLLEGTESAIETLLECAAPHDLRALRVELADVRIQWASVLLSVAKRPDDALAQIEKARASGASEEKLHLLEAQSLLALGRASDAERLVEALRKDDAPDTVLTVAAILLDADRPADAWAALEPVIAKLEHARIASSASNRERPHPLRLLRWDEASLEERIRLRAAEALEKSGDARRSLAVLEPLAETRPLDASVAHRFSRALRLLERDELATAIERRSQNLAPFRFHIERAIAATRAGDPLTAAYQRGRAAERAGRLGHAIHAFGDGLKQSPRTITLHVAQVEALMVAGLLERAMLSNTRLWESWRSPTLTALQARLFARAQRPEFARPLIERVRDAPAGSDLDKALLSANLVRALLELGDVERVETHVETIERLERSAPPEALATAALARATLALIGGRLREARDLASQQALEPLDLLRWAKAIELLAHDDESIAESDAIAFAASGVAAPDISPLIDHPWLLNRARLDRLSPRAATIASEASRVVNECDAIEASTPAEAGAADERFRRLCALYRDHGARAKELETAWLWLLESPDVASAWQAVATAHSRPGEELELLSVCGLAKARGLELDDLDAAYERALERIGGRP